MTTKIQDGRRKRPILNARKEIMCNIIWRLDQPRNSRSHKLFWRIHTPMVLVTSNKFSFVVLPTILGNSGNLHKSKMAVEQYT